LMSYYSKRFGQGIHSCTPETKTRKESRNVENRSLYLHYC
jgi:hypothetical protein